ncbi:Imm26 family immunity protein [Shewanella colwelliana]|uniref:Imm26 family immunity protein n=1 Tax=Shewanella colwelliana TaxID=23 RepID=UPI003735648C
MSKLLNLIEGDIYSIPLFLSTEPDNKSFSRYKFGKEGEKFVFCRVISDLKGSGELIEVFNCISNFDVDIFKVISSPLVFPALAITGDGIYKKRWRRVGGKEDYVYDKVRDSNFNNINLFENNEPVKIWRASHLEQRIIDALASNK